MNQETTNKIKNEIQKLLDSGEIKNENEIYELTISKIIKISDKLEVPLDDLLCYLCCSYNRDKKHS